MNGNSFDVDLPDFFRDFVVRRSVVLLSDRHIMVPSVWPKANWSWSLSDNHKERAPKWVPEPRHEIA